MIMGIGIVAKNGICARCRSRSEYWSFSGGGDDSGRAAEVAALAMTASRTIAGMPRWRLAMNGSQMLQPLRFGGWRPA